MKVGGSSERVMFGLVFVIAAETNEFSALFPVADRHVDERSVK